MRRLWLGVALLAILLLLGLGTTRAMDRIHPTAAGELTQAGAAALEGDWEQARSLSRSAQARWQERWHFTAGVADHGPMEEIDSLMAQLEVYARLEEEKDFAALCFQLSRLLKAMGEAHSFTWWNLL